MCPLENQCSDQNHCTVQSSSLYSTFRQRSPCASSYIGWYWERMATAKLFTF